MDLFLHGGQAVSLPGVALLGVAVGFVAGMFGVGGGFLLVPLMHVFLGVSFPVAVGVGLCQTIATGIGSYMRYRRMGHAETRFDVMLLAGSLLGVHAGGKLLRVLSTMEPWVLFDHEFPAYQFIITMLYCLVFFTMAWLLFTRSESGGGGNGPLCRLHLGPRAALPVAEVKSVSGAVVGLVGLINGILAGLLGIGGGICLIPIMLYGFGFEIRKVAGTGIIVVILVAILGTIESARAGHVHLGLAMTAMIGSVISAQIGADLTRTLPKRVLSRGLAVVLLITNGALLCKLFLY
jgi:uncharacterized membrane protein YfcA